MRRCAVSNCPNSDRKVLCHRFPKSRATAQIWQENLNLDTIPLDALMAKFTVCYMHFNSTDYRNSQSNSLNLNAIPQLNPSNPRKDATKNNKIKEFQQPPPYSSEFWSNVVDQHTSDMTPANISDSIELLEEEADEATELGDNIICTPSGSDDICILPEEQNAADDLIQSIDGAGFTLLDAASCTFMNESKTFENSQNLTNQKYSNESDSGNSNDLAADSTDSDVEVLVSESIFESQWSETDCSAIVLKACQTNSTDSALSQCVSSKSNIAFEVLDSEYKDLDKQKLIEIIKKQSTHIELLEQKLQILRTAQQTLMEHFNEFKQTVCDGDSI